MTGYKFEVRLVDFEPMSGTKGKRKYVRKKDLVEAITRAKGNELEEARRAFLNKRIGVTVEFYLLEKGPGHSDSTGKKDIDNLLKLVFDALQTQVDSQNTMKGLGLISNDDAVFSITAKKVLVKDKEEVGLGLELAEFAS